MKRTPLGLCWTLLASAPLLGACGGDGASPEQEAGALPSPGPAAPGSPVTAPSSPPPAAGIAPAAAGEPSREGNPPITGLGDSEPEGAAPGAPPTPPEAAAGEPGDCIIPPALAAPVGYGAATTGGGAATPVVVETYEEAQAVLDAYRDAFKEGTESALVLTYAGRFDFSTITDVCAQHEKDAQILEVKEIENVTLQGAPGSSANFGIKVSRSKNIIIRNMTMGLLPGGGASDAITLEGNDTNGDVEDVWVDHNELFSSTKDDCDGAGDTEFDGLIDIKKGARRITVSYNYLHDHQKTGLLGSSDDDETERYVTFHHNRYENVVSRTPLHRFGFIHLFNNYFGAIASSGINVRMGGVALIERNFFENARNPVTSRYSPAPGLWDLRDNHLGPNITWDVEEDTLANADTWESTTAFPESELGYAYAPDSAACVKQIVFAQAGAKL